jgi:hypothetical protein
MTKLGRFGFMADILRLITPEDAAALGAEPEWKPPATLLAPTLKEDVREMTDADIEAFARWSQENGQSACLGMPLSDESVDMFFKNFQCRRCGKCCKGPLLDGIAIMPSEVRRISRHLGISETAFMNKYVGARRSHLYGLLAYPCLFMKGETSCSIYPIRPMACRVFPMDFATFKGYGNELGVQAFCPAALDLFIKITKLRIEILRREMP